MRRTPSAAGWWLSLCGACLGNQTRLRPILRGRLHYNWVVFRAIPGLAIAFVTVAAASGSAGVRTFQDIDYSGLYARGITFAAFLENARARRDEWRAHYNDATVTPALMTRMRALPDKRRLLVVAEDWCSDSANTVPIANARLVCIDG